MDTISQREMRNNSATILRRVAAGESFVITNGGVEVAKLVPYSSDQHAERQQLIADGVLRARTLRRGPLTRPVATTVDVGALLDEDRGDR